MARFDPDFSIFGILAGDLYEGVSLEDTRIDYINSACMNLYGDLSGKTLAELFAEITGSAEDGRLRLHQFDRDGRISFEGELSGRFVKFHSRIIDCRDDDACSPTKYVQAGVMDITESVILKRLLFGTSEALKRAAEAADDDTGRHIIRINRYSGLLAKLYGVDNLFYENISNFAQLHDIGKIKIAEIIRVPRQLTAEEFEEVKKHPQYGGKMVEGLAGLEFAYDIILDHHEKWDGSGYPDGKRQEEISLAGRIVALADVFDALVSERPYKKRYGYRKARIVLEYGDGRVMPGHFEPKLLRLFLENYNRFADLHDKMRS